MTAMRTLLLAGSLYGLWRCRPGESLAGSVALVTGGSRGLGYLLAERLLAGGCRVAICARHPARLERALARLREGGRAIVGRTCDVTDRDAVGRLVTVVTSSLGPIDILVNNASIIRVAPLGALREEDFREVMEIDFWGTFNVTRAVLPGMLERGRGRIANIASIGGRVAVPHLLPYDVAKFAVTGFSEGLRAELAGSGVHVLTVVPGLMRTGSPIGVDVKGRHEPEFAWFAAADSVPLISMDALRAARRIVRAIRQRRSHLTLTWQARALEVAHALWPSGVVSAFGLANRLLPPDGQGTSMRTGRELFPTLPTPWLRRRLLELGERTNQPVEGLTP